MTALASLQRRLSGRVGRDAPAGFARGAAAAFVIQGLGLLLAWIVQIALARAMPRADFGIYTALSALMTTLAVPATLGLPVALARFLPKYRVHSDWRHTQGLLRYSQAVTLGAGCGLALLTGGIALALRAGGPPGALLVGLTLIPALALSTLLMQTLRGMGRIEQAISPSALLQPLFMLLPLALLLGIGTKIGAGGGVTLLAVSTCGALAVQYAWVSRRTREEIGEAPIQPAYETSRWLQAAWPLLLATGFQMALAQMDILTMAALRTDREVAVYGAAYRVSRLIGFWTYGVYLALGPVIARAHASGDKPAMQRAATWAVRWTFWPSLAAMGLLFALGRPLLSLYGPGFGGGYAPLCILGLGFLANTGAGPGMVVLNMTGHPRVVSSVSGWTALVGILLCLLLTAKLGAAGAALASALAMAGWNIGLAIWVNNHLGIHVFFWNKPASAKTSARDEREEG